MLSPFLLILTILCFVKAAQIRSPSKNLTKCDSKNDTFSCAILGLKNKADEQAHYCVPSKLVHKFSAKGTCEVYVSDKKNKLCASDMVACPNGLNGRQCVYWLFIKDYDLVADKCIYLTDDIDTSTPIVRTTITTKEQSNSTFSEDDVVAKEKSAAPISHSSTPWWMTIYMILCTPLSGFENDENLNQIDSDERRFTNETLFHSSARHHAISRLSRKATKHRLLELIFTRFPQLHRVQRKAMRFVLKKASKYELTNALVIFKKLCPTKHNCDLLPPLRFMEYPIQYSRQHRIAMCMIPKNMSTLMTAIMCYLHDKERIKRVKNKRFYEQWGDDRTCTNNEARSWGKVERGVGASRQNIRKFVLVRNPAERFLSAYEHLCVDARYCLGCKNQACVIDTLYEKSKSYLKNGQSITKLRHEIYHFDAHFFPQSWRCDFQTMRTAYTLIHVTSKKQEKLADDMAHYFKWKGVSSEDVKFVHNHIANGRNSHSTVNKHRSMNKKDRSNLYHTPSTLRKFLSIFYFDYLILGYSLPKESLI
ncbi:unnamed protein product, partial [Mesorhabditis belari]|uniref:Uncharacterized protein n=1 Tax=Mesorhabditis belari TaxID=2138241 RepID=A0AAF3JC69_9BILA